MKLRSLHPKTFTQLLEVLKDTITDVLIHFHTDSIKIRAADTAKTCITYVHIPGNTLEQYECDRYQPVGVNIPKLWTVLKTSTADDVLQMDFEEHKDGTLNIAIIDSNTNAPKLKTGYITYECDEEALTIPDNLHFGSCISMSSIRLYSDLKTLENMEAEFVKLKQCKSPSGGNRLQLIGTGSQFHRDPCMDIDELPNSASGNTPQEASSGGDLEDIEMTFPLKKLVNFAKAHCLDDKVAIHLDSRGFLILQYKIKIYGELRFVVMAINDDDDDDDDDSESPSKRQCRAADSDEEDDE